MKKRPLVDEKCFDLAKHFLPDESGATEDQVWELADAIQSVCELHSAPPDTGAKHE